MSNENNLHGLASMSKWTVEEAARREIEIIQSERAAFVQQLEGIRSQLISEWRARYAKKAKHFLWIIPINRQELTDHQVWIEVYPDWNSNGIAAEYYRMVRRGRDGSWRAEDLQNLNDILRLCENANHDTVMISATGARLLEL